MHCPDCQSGLNKIEIKDHYGQDFEIEQCPACGGFWFDKGELYRVPIDVGLKIDFPVSRRIYQRDLKCPYDKVLLVEFSDPNLPPFLQLYRCPECAGYFLPKGQLYAYKDYQKQRLSGSLMQTRKLTEFFSLLFFTFLASFVGLLVSENMLKADEVVYERYHSTLSSVREKLLYLILGTVLGFLISAIRGHYLTKKSKIS